MSLNMQTIIGVWEVKGSKKACIVKLLKLSVNQSTDKKSSLQYVMVINHS